MSKLYDKYIELKSNNKEKIYLINSGVFYIAIDEDAKILNEKLHLKLTNLNKNIFKVGFPINKLEEYEKRFKLLNLEYEVVTIKSKSYKNIIDDIRCLSIEALTEGQIKGILKNIQDNIVEVDNI